MFLDCSTCQIFFSWMNLSMKAAVCFMCCSISCVSRLGLKLNSLLFSCALICFALYLPNPFHLQTCPSFLVFSAPPSLPHVLSLSRSLSISWAVSSERGAGGRSSSGAFSGTGANSKQKAQKTKKRKKECDRSQRQREKWCI